VEDNPADQRLALEAFKKSRWNATPRVVDDGQEALDYLHQKGKYAGEVLPDLIILDLNLPRVDGREVLEKVKHDPRTNSIPIVVLTSSAAREDIRRCYELCANSYVMKPTDIREFFDTMQSIEDYWFGVSTTLKN
jgi:CheY-like chemotaxis protein